VRLTTSAPSCAECHEIWEPKPPETLWGTPGLLRGSFTFAEIHQNVMLLNPLTAESLVVNEVARVPVAASTKGSFPHSIHPFHIPLIINRIYLKVCNRLVFTINISYVHCKEQCTGCWPPAIAQKVLRTAISKQFFLLFPSLEINSQMVFSVFILVIHM